MSISRIIQLFLGFIIGIAALAGASAATGYYFFTRLDEDPPRPVFEEEKPKPPPQPAAKASPAQTPNAEEKPSEQPSPEPKEEKLEPGAYKARVTWPEGLSLRDEPTAGAERIGGIPFKGEMIVLKESEDGQWQKVRLPNSDRVGWVKGGNSEKIE